MDTEFAPAKVNLALHVVGRREDGYHLLDSLVVFADVGDTLTAEAAETISLDVTGPFGAALVGGDNLVLRAARLLAASGGVRDGARLTLRKELPVAAGIGGGSADAAAALRLLTRMWRLDVPAADVSALALRLGADVPVCLAGRPARMSGVGEVLSPLPALPACGLVLANPGVAVATRDVFRGRMGAFSGPLAVPARWADAAALAATVLQAGNDLEEPAVGIAPAIADVLGALREQGCLLARMSGSGATCFGLFASAGEAEVAAARLARRGWWVWGGGLHGFGLADGARAT